MAGHDGGDRQAVGERLGHRQHVRGGARVLDGEHAPGAGQAALDLVGDEQDAVLVAERTQRGQEARRRHHETTLAEDRLDDDRRHRLRRHRGGEHAIDVLTVGDGTARARSVVARAKAVRIAHVVHAGQERADPGPIFRPAGGERHRRVGAPVERTGERDHLGASGGTARQLHGSLDGLGAAVAEEDLVEALGRDAHQRLGRLDHPRMHGGHRGVPQAVHLLVDRLHDGRMAVPETGDADAAAEVEHVATVDRAQVRATGRLHHQVGVAAVGWGDQLRVALAPDRDTVSHGGPPCPG